MNCHLITDPRLQFQENKYDRRCNRKPHGDKGLKVMFSTTNIFIFFSFKSSNLLNSTNLSIRNFTALSVKVDASGFYKHTRFDRVWLLYLFLEQQTTIKMMRVIIPNFKNFDNVAICPSDSGMDIFCVVTGGSGLYIDFSSISTGGVTCMEYLPGYMYVFYSNGDNVAPSSGAVRFKSEREMKDYLVRFYGTPHVSGGYLTRIPVVQGEAPQGASVPVFKEYVKEDPEKLCLSLLMEVVTESFTARNVCQDLIEDCMSDIFRPRPLRCKKCFVTHFPWMKICKKYILKTATHSKPENVKPKSRGGAKQPKMLKDNGPNSRDILTILRSLDMFQSIDHEKCPMATKAELCDICLIRSLVLRANSLKGRNTIIPQEFLALDLGEKFEEAHPTECLERVFESFNRKINFYKNMINTLSGCRKCPPSNSLFLDYFNHLEPARGKDVAFLLDLYEKTSCEDHRTIEKHFNHDSKVFFFKSDVGVSVKIFETLKFQSKEWRVKSVVGRDYRTCSIHGAYYEVHGDSLVLTEKNSFEEAILIA